MEGVFDGIFGIASAQEDDLGFSSRVLMGSLTYYIERNAQIQG